MKVFNRVLSVIEKQVKRSPRQILFHFCLLNVSEEGALIYININLTSHNASFVLILESIKYFQSPFGPLIFIQKSFQVYEEFIKVTVMRVSSTCFIPVLMN